MGIGMKVKWSPVMFLVLLMAYSVMAAAEGAQQPGNAEMGKRIYREGLLASGAPLIAVVKENLRFSGKQAACVNCHRRSGYGGGEGNTVIRPVTGPSLYNPVNTTHRNMNYVLGKIALKRSAYTDESLARTLREGIDPSGRSLVEPMPHYELGDEDMKNLLAYLKSLSATQPPGITDDVIHFAAVITPDVDPVRRKTMLETLEGFFSDKNAGTRHETLRKEHGPWDMEREYKSYRQWQLHVWELTGPADGWRGQLEEYYRQQPVFAMLSGMGMGTWRPVHDFCERNEIPCLFPVVDVPVIDGTDYYSVYFSRGVVLEAQVLARYLSRDKENSGTLVQVFRDNETGRTMADAFRKALADAGGLNLEDRSIPAGESLTPAFWQKLLADGRISGLVLWLEKSDLNKLGAVASGAYSGRIYLSSSLAGEISLPEGLTDRVYATYPYALPQDMERRLMRVRLWLQRKGMALTDPRVQEGAYFASHQAGEALMHMLGNFSRDYFIEEIEHSVDNHISTSVYPTVTLGPGQRFAAKGSYVVKLSGQGGKTLVPVSDWVVP